MHAAIKSLLCVQGSCCGTAGGRHPRPCLTPRLLIPGRRRPGVTDRPFDESLAFWRAQVVRESVRSRINKTTKLSITTYGRKQPGVVSPSDLHDGLELHQAVSDARAERHLATRLYNPWDNPRNLAQVERLCCLRPRRCNLRGQATCSKPASSEGQT
jgi:hypothetical protein